MRRKKKRRRGKESFFDFFCHNFAGRRYVMNVKCLCEGRKKGKEEKETGSGLSSKFNTHAATS